PGPPGLPLMDGLAREPGIHYVLALQEAVAIAMADAYAQASGGLAAVNVHVSPGLGNAMGMLYDASKSGAPMLLTAGQHDQGFNVTEPTRRTGFSSSGRRRSRASRPRTTATSRWTSTAR